jgi:hypothetical protein
MDIRRATSLVAMNVVPQVQSVRTESFGSVGTASSLNLGNLDVSFDPTTINIQAAAGGYGTVLQFSPGFCLQAAATDLGLAPVYIQLDYWGLKAFFQNNSNSLTNALQAFYSSIDWSEAPDIELTFTPASLQFPSTSSVTITFTAKANLLALQALPLVQGQGGGISTGRSAAKVAVPYFLGNMTLSISAPFSAVPHASLLGAEVICLLAPPRQKATSSGIVKGPQTLNTAQISVAPDPGQDVAVFFNQGMLGDNGEDVINVLAGKFQFRLVPSLSLLGLEPINSKGVNMLEFQVDAIALAGEDFPVLAVGFNLKTACAGSPDHIQQFIGSFDFGTITDEFTIETLFKHKWGLPGRFSRTIPVSAPIHANVNNQGVDVTLDGTLQLNTLDVVTIDSDANTRTDVLSIQGTATVTVNDAVAQDGTRIGPDQIDFGPPEDVLWAFKSALLINAAFDTRPGIRTFEMTAYKGAYNFIARPFANLSDPSPVSPYYARLDAVVHRVYTVSLIGADFPF